MKGIKISLPSTIFLFAIICLNGCGEVQNGLSSSSIIDGKGLSIDLDWTTRSNVSTALIEADLDLDVYKGDGEILSSYNSGEFEHVDLTNLFEDGAYTVRISLYEICKRSDYTLKMRGAANGKTFKVSGFFKAADDQPVSILKITKAGERFTLSTL